MLGLALLLLGVTACGDDGVTVTDGRVITIPGHHVKYPTVDGFQRSFALYVPESIDFGGPPVPAIMVLHGFPPTDMSVVTRMNDAADRDGFIAVYPKSASGTEWAMACDKCSPNAARGVDDVHYFRVVINDLIESLPVDSERIYLTGFSNGGMMTYRGFCDLSDEIAAFAPVGAGMWTWHIDNCSPDDAVPVMMINGTEDPQFPWEGVAVAAPLVGGELQVPILEHVGALAAVNGCDPDPAIQNVPDLFDDGTTLQRWNYQGCGAETVFYRIEGGGHTWPGMDVDFGPGLGTKSLELAGTDTIVAFLLRQRR